MSLSDGERITSIIPVSDFAEDQYLLMLTANGYVKKVSLMYFSSIRSSGIIALQLVCLLFIFIHLQYYSKLHFWSLCVADFLQFQSQKVICCNRGLYFCNISYTYSGTKKWNLLIILLNMSELHFWSLSMAIFAILVPKM